MDKKEVCLTFDDNDKLFGYENIKSIEPFHKTCIMNIKCEDCEASFCAQCAIKCKINDMCDLREYSCPYCQPNLKVSYRGKTCYCCALCTQCNNKKIRIIEQRRYVIGMDDPRYYVVDILCNDLENFDNNLIKYNCEYPLQNNDIKEKSKQTNLLKYGVEYPIQNPEIMEKQIKSSHNRKNYEFPSGRTEIVQGYEPFALNDLIINEKINESHIIVGVKNVPEIKFIGEDGKSHRYYVDIFIPCQNRCIEVKSLYTYNDNKTINLLKKDAAIKLGYNFEFWIYDNKGKRINNCDDKCC